MTFRARSCRAVINSIAKDVKITTIYGGVLPFILTDIIRMALLVVFPIISLWLPMTMAKQMASDPEV